jgi:PleD family two-component response regulator
MISKQAELAAFELGVSDGVVELEKVISRHLRRHASRFHMQKLTE